MPRLGHYLIDGQRRPKNRRVPREAAVFAVVHTLVGDVKRREQPHRLAEMPAGHLLTLSRERFERTAGFLGDKLEKPPHQRSRALQKIWKNIRKSHGGRNVLPPAADVKGGLRELAGRK